MILMRFSVLVLALVLLLPAGAVSGRTPERDPDAGTTSKAPIADLDTLFDALGHARTEADAKLIEGEIWAIWAHSGSPTADLLLERAMTALENEDVETARLILDALVELAPDFAEAWHRRGEAAALAEDYETALLCLRKALALEPRHFAALTGLGSIFEEYGDKPAALEAYRRALAINPFIAPLGTIERRLSRDVEGQKI